MSFSAKQVGFTYGLRDASFELPRTGLVTIAGPNGAGKSTLLGVMAGLRAPYRGSCMYADREVRQWPKRDFARRVAFLPQAVRVEFPFTVEEVVLMGRTPYAHGWYESPRDREIADQAMTTTDTLEFRARDFRSLSGGERQRVILASALVQEPEALLLDEPATFLDVKHQLALYRLLTLIARATLVVAVTHDLNLALQFSQHVLVMEDGRIAGDGVPSEVLNPDLIGRVFGVHASIETGDSGLPWMRYEA
ncbi:MAG: ABC transporter ATP-binding protein [Bryobacteraceae bacterium]